MTCDDNPHNYKRESLNYCASFLQDRWSNPEIWYTKSTQNFMEIDMTRPDFPNFASPLYNKGRELPGRTLYYSNIFLTIHLLWEKVGLKDN